MQMPHVLTAQEIYQTQVQQLTLAERLRLTALLLDDLHNLPALTSVSDSTKQSGAMHPRPKRGSGKQDISFLADDFDAPLEEMREYSE